MAPDFSGVLTRRASPRELWSGTVRLIRSAPAAADVNMALDEAMLATAGATGDTLVRLYEWAQPSVSFGRNQRTAGIYDATRCASLGVPAVRRLTGGRALLHAREVTYAVAAPSNAAATLRSGYEAINDLLLMALRSLGVDVERAVPIGRTAMPDRAPCFESPSAGELVVAGRKLVGSAQHREASAFLQHGSILLDDDQGFLREIAVVPLPDVPTPATLRGLIPGIDTSSVVTAITESLRAVAAGGIVVCPDADIQLHHFQATLTRYRDPHWTWRR